MLGVSKRSSLGEITMAPPADDPATDEYAEMRQELDKERIRFYTSLMSFSVKGIFTLNGAACIAILSFGAKTAPSAILSESSLDTTSLYSIAIFLLGLSFSMLGMQFLLNSAFLSLRAIVKREVPAIEKGRRKMYGRIANAFMVGAVGCFFIGCMVALGLAGK